MKKRDTRTETDQKRRAVIYARMSTEHQQYSTENQADVIREYAQAHGMEVVRSYVDEGKSGLRIDGRDALKELIDVVESGRANFEVILVYDVSRWGRFQDADESAYYEYICRCAGIEVAYCAEQFQNDGSPVSTIVKGVKRAMAGFGLRRMLVDMEGNQKGVLGHGEHKSIQTDRGVLVPGPDDEVRTVRWIFERFVEGGHTEREIAEALNARGVRTDLGRRWTHATVKQVLTNEAGSTRRLEGCYVG